MLMSNKLLGAGTIQQLGCCQLLWGSYCLYHQGWCQFLHGANAQRQLQYQHPFNLSYRLKNKSLLALQLEQTEKFSEQLKKLIQFPPCRYYIIFFTNLRRLSNCLLNRLQQKRYKFNPLGHCVPMQASWHTLNVCSAHSCCWCLQTWAFLQ